MKTHTMEWTDLNERNTAANVNPVGHVNSALRLASNAFIALVPAVLIVVGAAWLITVPSLVVYLQATLWTSGIVFLGLALDSQKSTIALSIATGLALPALAVLSSKLAIEFAVVAAALIAAWVAAAIWHR